MRLEEIEALWDKDCIIDRVELAKESLMIPKLHNKYYKLYLREKLILKKMKSSLNKLRSAKRLWYDGKFAREDLEEWGWNQCLIQVQSKDLNTYVDGDDDVIQEEIKTSLQEEKVEYLRSIINNITQRSFVIKNAIEFIKFTNGEI